ncbi:MAG: lysophospholipid acyltransferase family protein [Deltaproteobacteria bacterium]
MRISYIGFDKYRRRIEGGSRIILAFWHGRLLMMPYSYPGRGITILVSQSKDGELVSRTVKGFGIDSVRGSSSKGWFAGVKGLLKSVQAGRDVAITPDGPRGPGSKAQMGAVQIARATGLPIFPMAFGASRVKKFRSWDSFVLPYPFTRGVFICGEPISVAKDAEADDMEAARSRLEDALNGLTERADRYFSGR